MPLNIIVSSRTEILVQDLVQALCAPGDPSVVRRVLLPSRPLVEKVGCALARAQGVALGVDFLLPGAFFDRIAAALELGPLDAAWEPEGLFWRLLDPVRASAARPGSRLASARDDERALVSLTRQIADRFDQYMHYRPAMIQAWDRGEAWAELPDEVRVDEDWQRELWKRLKPAVPGLGPHLVARFEAMKARLAALEADPFGQSLEVLSTGPLPGGMLEMLEVLGRKCAVNLRMLMPSREYLKHIKSVARQRRAGEEPDKDREGNPLLASMGQQAVDSFCALDDLLDRVGGDFSILDRENSPEEGAQASLLRAMQDDIRAARQPDPLRRPLAGGEDRSLRVHRCHGPRREVEVLRDEILRAFEDLEGLRAEDVLVLSPNLEAHAPLAASLLPAPGYGIPLALAETGEALEDPLLRALTALLSFAAGRAALSEGLGLLDLPAVQRVLGDEGVRALAARLENSGVSFGLDAAHRLELGAGNEATGTWRFGLDRLLQGLWLGEEENAERPDQVPCLPQAGELSSGRGEALQALRWMDALLSTALRWRVGAADPADWALRLREAADGLFAHTDTSQESLAGVLEWLSLAGQGLGCAVALGPGALADHLLAFSQDEARQVRAVGGRLALGGLKPLRALPCRVLALLGLSDPAFPRRANAPAWDLMAAKHVVGDRDPREEDRQLFLDALLSAADRVIITAPTRHGVTDKQIPFSVCVDEVLRCAQSTGAANPALVQDHPLQPFTPSNFSTHGSFDRANHALAEAVLGQRRPLPFAPAGFQAAAKDIREAPTCAGLLRFFRDPARAWLASLDLRLPERLEEEAGDDEPMDLENGLRRWQVTQTLMDRALEGGPDLDLGRLVDRMAADRLLPYGTLGRALAWSTLDALAGPLEILRTRCGGVDRMESALALPEALSGTLRLARKGSSLVFLTASSWDSARLPLDVYVQACLASAGGRPLATLALARKGGGGADMELREIPAPPVEDAKRYLKTLLNLRQQGLGMPLCFDPDISLKLAKLGDGVDVPAWEEAFALSRSPSLALVCRDRDPFGDEGWRDWQRSAAEILGPALAWMGQDPDAGGPGDD
jgi:exodeoxyribonuclease V gamma subunit